MFAAPARRITFKYYSYTRARERTQGKKPTYWKATTRRCDIFVPSVSVSRFYSAPAVIINEHLMEALRRLRRNSSDTNVDRRLVTNVILSFLTTPRADPKRFEMLSLLSSILSWTDQEREKAGLQRSGASAVPATFWGRPSSASGSPAKGAELDKSDETEVWAYISHLPFFCLLLTHLVLVSLPTVLLATLGRILTHRSKCWRDAVASLDSCAE